MLWEDDKIWGKKQTTKNLVLATDVMRLVEIIVDDHGIPFQKRLELHSARRDLIK